ncbi:MAG TPA: coiled coil domain-containing protein [Bacteroidota bacterium]
MEKKTFMEKMEAQLKVWDAEIQALSAKAEEARVDLKADLQAQIKTLVAKRESAQKRLQELRGKSGDAWVELRGGIETAWRDLRESIDKAVDKLK